MELILILTILLPTASCACIDGWVAHNGSCYHFSHDKEEMTGAMYMCNVMGGRLLEIDDESKMTYVSRVALLFRQNYWTGLTDSKGNGVWGWIGSKRTLKDIGYSNWDVGYPVATSNNEHCGSLWYGTSLWRNVNCLDEMHFICESQDLGIIPVG